VAGDDLVYYISMMEQIGTEKMMVIAAIREAGRANGGNRIASRLRGGALAGLGILGVLFAGIPVWATRRLLYPLAAEPLPQSLDEGLPFEAPVHPERVEFEARDGKILTGWFVPGPDPDASQAPKPWPCVLLVHGYGGYKEQMAGYAQMVHEGGFATLMFDMPGSGSRWGEPVSLGYKERWDLMDAARYVRSRPDVDPERIGVLGVSLGASTALLAAAEDQSLKAIVADSGFAHLIDMVKPGLKAFVGLPSFPFAPIIVRYAETILGMKAGEIRPEHAAAELGDRPLLVIHGADDPLIDVESAYRIYDAASGPKELWIVPDCLHAQAPAILPEEYKRRVNDFFSRRLVATPKPALTAAG
jgi:fermentation-respiration switch protein FrsA (DUF1100 family)